MLKLSPPGSVGILIRRMSGNDIIKLKDLCVTG